MVSHFDLLVLSHLPGIGSARVRALTAHCGDPSAVLRADAQTLAGAEGMTRNLAARTARILRGSSELGEARAYAAAQLFNARASGASIVALWDEGYPAPLTTIYDPPPFLFARGAYGPSDGEAIAIVGTRTPSAYGRQAAAHFAAACAAQGITVVSGLARGIDTEAHAAALAAGGRTIAVTGSGIDVCYPPENGPLAERIAARGAVLTEQEMGAAPDAEHFPRRNRIVSGLAAGTLVVESGLDGGAMITAASALDQNREVFAVPGGVFSVRSRGCHALIREGRAKLVERIDDLLAELPSIAARQRAAPAVLAPEGGLFGAEIADLLADAPLHVDAIAARSGRPAAETLAILLALELRGAVRQLPGKLFVRSGRPSRTPKFPQ